MQVKARSKSIAELHVHTNDSTSLVTQVIECAADVGGFERPSIDRIHTVAIHTGRELRALYEVALGIHDSDSQIHGDILQCGTYRGCTAAILAMANLNRAHQELVITIDRFQYESQQSKSWARGVFEAHKALFHKFDLQRTIVSVLHDDLRYLDHFWNSPLRAAVLDSAHPYNHVKRQLERLVPYIIPGGWLIVHDYGAPDHEGVTQAVDEWLNTAPDCVLHQADAFLFANLI